MTTKTTKTYQLRVSRDQTIRIIESNTGRKFLLIQREKMVEIMKHTQPGHALKYDTNYNNSLPWSIVRRMVTKKSGYIQGAWTYTISPNSFRIGCQMFSGVNASALHDWARGF